MPAAITNNKTYSAIAYSNLSPEKRAKRLAQMKAYYEKNKDKILARHNLRNANEKRFLCQACNKYYKSNFNLNIHYNSNKHKKNVRLQAINDKQNPENNGATEPPRENKSVEVSV